MEGKGNGGLPVFLFVALFVFLKDLLGLGLRLLDEGGEVREGAGLEEEGMLEELSARGALVRHHAGALLDKVLELGRHRIRIFVRRSSLGHNQKESAHGGGFVHVGRLAFAHLDGHHTGAPDVDLDTVGFGLDDLGGHPVGRSDDRQSLCLLLVQLCSISEISDLDATVEGDHDVVGLDITMDDLLFVQVAETSDGLSQDQGDLRLGHLSSGSDDLRQILSVDQLHSNPKDTVDEETVVELDDGRVAAHAHEHDLVDQDLLVDLAIDDDLLDGDLVSSGVLSGQIH
mmetsp:Transcript_6196/g.10094  ORF Transcript_6196/g.10094 Transcript_6196/m.10094 type:complete len:286 (+) Transcript_6196:177-1034(+)